MNLNLITQKFNNVAKVNKKYKISFPGIELECKVQFDKVYLNNIISHILFNIHKGIIELDGVANRTEFHHFYKNKNIHRVFIFVQGSTEVWIKEKSKAQIIHSPKYNAPILIRKEKKLTPKNSIYNRIFIKTLKDKYIGSFKKQCIDISFWFKNSLFTMTIAKSNTVSSELSQIEIEYDGSTFLSKLQTKKIISSLFDYIIPICLPKSTICFTTKTKLEWLEYNQN